MAIDGTSATTATTATSGTSATQQSSSASDIFGGLGPDAFLKLLVAQIQYQNPMNPSDPTAMMGQIAQYAQVEALNKLQAGQTTDQSLSEAKMATDMVGKTISATDGTNTETGKVLSARFTSTGPVLVLDSGAEVTLSAVVTVTDSSATTTATATTSTATTPTTPSTTSTDPTTPSTSTTSTFASQRPYIPPVTTPASSSMPADVSRPVDPRLVLHP